MIIPAKPIKIGCCLKQSSEKIRYDKIASR